MSKVGRKKIDVSKVQLSVNGQNIDYKGPKASGTHELPQQLRAYVDQNKLTIEPRADLGPKQLREVNAIWGLHRALLANKIAGSIQEFERHLIIDGLGFKAKLSGKDKVILNLGFTHDITFDLPAGITLEIDKSGQKLVVKSSDKELVGLVSSQVRSLRPPEPYKGTGIRYADEVIVRKAGKTKGA